MAGNRATDPSVTANPMNARILASFDQAMSRGIPAMEAARAIRRKFDVRHDRVMDVLHRSGSVYTWNLDETEPVCWTSMEPSTTPRTVQSRTRTDLVQAAVDFALAHELLSVHDVATHTPAELIRRAAEALDKLCPTGQLDGSQNRTCTGTSASAA